MRRPVIVVGFVLVLAQSAWADEAKVAKTGSSTAKALTAESSAAKSPFGKSDVLRTALKAEMQRALTKLELPSMPKPYFIQSTLNDSETFITSATLGAVTSRQRSRDRSLDVDLRVGDYHFDNSGFAGGGMTQSSASLAIEDDGLEVRRSTWLAIDAAYKSASETYEAKRAARQSQAQGESHPDSFVRVETEKSIDENAQPLGPETRYVELAREVSAALRDFDHIQASGVSVAATTSRRIVVTTEGTEIVEPDQGVSLMVWAGTQAPDGMMLSHHVSAMARSISELPSAKELQKSVVDMVETLAKLRAAPVVENYSGPVLFEGAAAAQLLEGVLAQELSGTPPPEMPGGIVPEQNSLASRVGLRVLPADFSVIDDPGLETFEGERLFAGYDFDDQAVRAERVEIVKNGTLVQLLMSRRPSKEFKTSNGHGRASYLGYEGRPSNLVVRSKRGMGRQALKQALLREIRHEGLAHGFVVRRFEEPFSAMFSGALSGHAGAAMGGAGRTLLLYRVSADGKEELVRGGRLDGFGTDDLRDIVAASRELTVHHSGAMALPGILGRMGQGGLAASFVAPDLLIRKIDIRKPSGAHPKPPVMQRPPLRK